MDRRLMLDEKLRDLQQKVWGYQHTYFEPPESIHLQFNAVLYERTGINRKTADNKGYIVRDEYRITVITKDPEDILPKRITEEFSLCNPGPINVTDNLWHFTFTLYY